MGWIIPIIAAVLPTLINKLSGSGNDDTATVQTEKSTNKNTKAYFDWVTSEYEKGYKSALTNYFNWNADKEREWSKGGGGAIKLGMSTGGKHTGNVGTMVPKWVRETAANANPHAAEVKYYSDLFATVFKDSEMSETTGTETAESDDDLFSFSDVLNFGAMYYGSKRKKSIWSNQDWNNRDQSQEQYWED